MGDADESGPIPWCGLGTIHERRPDGFLSLPHHFNSLCSLLKGFIFYGWASFRSKGNMCDERDMSQALSLHISSTYHGKLFKSNLKCWWVAHILHRWCNQTPLKNLGVARNAHLSILFASRIRTHKRKISERGRSMPIHFRQIYQFDSSTGVA